jgi:O-antigen ligase
MSPLIFIAALTIAVWGTVLALRGSLIAGAMAVLVATCCFGPHFLSFDVAGTTISLDRVLLAGLVIAWMVQWRIGRVEFKPLTAADWVVLSFVGVLTASMLLHDWRNYGPRDVPIPQHLVNGYFIPLALFWIGRQATLSERNCTWILWGLTAFGVYLAITGLLESAGAWSLVFPQYIANPKIGLHFGRARGPMVHSVSYGLYLATCLLCLWLARERLQWRWQILVIAALAPLMMAAIFLTKTRSVWIGTGAGLVVVLALTLRGRVRLAVLGTMIAAAVVVGVANLENLEGLKREGTASDTRQSTLMRKSFAYTSWKMFQDRPIFGFGFGQYVRAKLPYLNDRSVDLPLEQIRPYVHHNTFLAVLTETGLVGLGLMLAVWACWLRTAWKLARGRDVPPWARRQGILLLGLLAITFWQMMGHEITLTAIDQSLIYFLAGVTVGLAPLARDRGVAARRQNSTNLNVGAFAPANGPL